MYVLEGGDLCFTTKSYSRQEDPICHIYLCKTWKYSNVVHIRIFEYLPAYDRLTYYATIVERFNKTTVVC